MLVKVDAANGVGGASVRRVMDEVRGDLVTIQLYNDGSGVLNDRVGWSVCVRKRRKEGGTEYKHAFNLLI